MLYRYEGSEPVVISRGDTAATSFDFLSLMQKNGAAGYFVELRAYNDYAESVHAGSSARYKYPPTYTIHFATADGASVENLATTDGTIVTLYAVWVPYTQTKTLENGVVITLTGSTKTIDQLVAKKRSLRA